MYVSKHMKPSLRDPIAAHRSTYIMGPCRPLPPGLRMDDFSIYILCRSFFISTREVCLPLCMGGIRLSQSHLPLHPPLALMTVTHQRVPRKRWSSASQNRTRITHLTGVLQKNGTLHLYLALYFVFILLRRTTILAAELCASSWLRNFSFTDRRLLG
jgi:hypothetical protein